MKSRPMAPHRAALTHDVLVAVGVFAGTFALGFADSVNGGKAALIALAGAAASASVKAFARAAFPGVVDHSG